MALSYRTPTEEVLNRFSAEDQNRIGSSAAHNFQEKEKSYGKFFSYHLPPKSKEKLSSAGIYLSPFPFLTHSHPCCKTLENHILYNVVADKLDSSFYFVGIKSNKLEFLKTVNKSLSTTESINRLVTSADRFRYGQNVIGCSSRTIYGIQSKKEIRLPPETRDLLPLAITNSAKNLFLHDEIHYWSKESLMDFLTILRPNIMVATIVFPPEILAGSPESLNPWCYKYKIEKGKLHFFPDGVMSESYTQNLSSGFLLKTKRIELPNGSIYGVDLVHNKFSHSVIVISQGHFINQEKRFFSNFCAIDFSKLYGLFDQRTYADCLPISFNLVSKIYRYLRTLKKPDQQSAMAKLSQLLDEPTALEIKFVEDFSSLVIKHESERSMICPSALKHFGFFLGRLLPDKLSRLINLVKSMSLDSFISNLSEFSFEITLEALSVHTDTSLGPIYKEVCFENGKAYVSNFDDVLNGREKRLVHSNPRGKYCYDIYEAVFIPFTTSEPELIEITFSMLLGNFSGSFKILVDFNEIFDILKNKCKPLLFSSESATKMEVQLRRIYRTRNRNLARNRSLYFSFSGLLWFLKKRAVRRNIKFLGRPMFHPKDTEPSLVLNFMSVVKEILSLGPNAKNILKADEDVLYWRRRGTTISKQNSKGKVNSAHCTTSPQEDCCIIPSIVNTSTPSFSNQVKLSLVEQAAGKSSQAFHLNCGIEIPIWNLNDQNFSFLFPDILRNRKAAWHTKGRAVDYEYSGIKHKALPWDDNLERFCRVNEIDEGLDCVLIQEYAEGGRIGFHADDELIFDQNFKITTVNLKGSCTFHFKCSTCDVFKNLENPVKFDMPAGFQASHKHSVYNCSKGRVSLTFRKLKLQEEEVETNEPEEIVNASDVGLDLKLQNLKGIYKTTDLAERSFKEVLEFSEMAMNSAAAVLNIEESAKLESATHYHVALTRCECVNKAARLRDSNFKLIKTDYNPGQNFFGNCVPLQAVCPFYFNVAELVNINPGLTFEFAKDKNALDRDGEITLVIARGQVVVILESLFGMESTKYAMFVRRAGDTINFPKSFMRLNSIRVHNTLEDTQSLAVFLQSYEEAELRGLKINHNCDDGLALENFNGVLMDRRKNLELNDFNVFEVPGDGNCFWSSVALCLGLDGNTIKVSCMKEAEKKGLLADFNVKRQFEQNAYVEKEGISICVRFLGLDLFIICHSMGFTVEMTPIGFDARETIFLLLKDQHYSPLLPKNGCVVRAIASALNKPEFKILSLVCKMEDRAVYETLVSGQGMQLAEVERVMSFFDIRAVIRTPEGTFISNPSGKNCANFELKNDHLLHVEHVQDIIGAPRSGLLSNFTESEAIVKLKSFCNQVNYAPSLNRAKMLYESLQDGTTGVMSSKVDGKLPRLMDNARDLNVGDRILNVMLGTFGSGKSTIYRKAFNESKTHDTFIISPRKRLAGELEILLGIKDKKGQFVKNQKGKKREVRVLTFEKFLLHLNTPMRGSVILDEIQLFPPGYLDLILINLKKESSIFLVGDPCQSDYDSASDRSIFYEAESDVINLLKNESYNFNIMSKRFRTSMFVGRLPCIIHDEENLIQDPDFSYLLSLAEAKEHDLSHFEVFLVSSFEEKKIILSHFGAGVECLTFGESTGLTFDRGIVVVSYESIATSERRWVTALSRFRFDLMLLSTTGLSIDEIALNFEGRFLAKYISRKASVSDLMPLLPGNPIFKRNFGPSIGKDEGIKESRLSGDPWLKTELFLGQIEDQEISEIEEVVAQEEWFKTHIPISGFESIRAKWVHRIMLKEYREVRCGYEVTNQFTDDYPNCKGEVLTNAAERFETIYPRHRGNDSVTFLMAVKKRLKFSQSNREAAKLRAAIPYGKFMMAEFLKKVPLKPHHDTMMMAQAKLDFEEKKVSKSAAVLENHSGRSCRDWLADVALIFMKSQLCTKFDNRFRDAKAGQTLACFQHSVLVRFAPYMRYIEKKIFEVLPKNFYIHSGKNLDDLDDWVKKNNFRGECTESDYEAFDSSQDHFILAFELEIMRYLGLPWDLIEDYRMIKITLRSKLGNFAIMRFTGEASTFLFNTMANMLFTFLTYDLNGSESICFAGDDMSANCRLKIKSEHRGFLGKLSLKAKVAFTSRPTFCGWNLTPKGIYKKPQLVFERLCIAREKNNLPNCLDSYAIEVAYAYQKGELIREYMDDEELESHYACVRFIVRNKHLLKSSVVEKFQNIA